MTSVNYYKGLINNPAAKKEQTDFIIDASAQNTIAINSHDRPINTDPTNFIISKGKIFDNIYRLSVKYLNINYSIPNCNPRNSSFILEDATGANPSVTVTLPTQVILNNTDLITALNAVLAPLAGYFAGIVASVEPLLKRVRLTGNIARPFRVVATTKTENLMGLLDNAYTALERTSIILGGNQVYTGLPPSLIYTIYIIFTSATITKFAKSDKSSGNDFGNEFLRFYIDQDFYSQEYGKFKSIPISQGSGNKQLKYAPAADLSDLDIKVYDQYGDLLYYDRLNCIFEYSLELLATNMPDQ